VRSRRLSLRPTPWNSTIAIVEGRRLATWASDYPDEGDVVVAQILHAGGPHVEQLDGVRFGHRQIVELATGQVVGGIGFMGPVEGGEIEVGYGVVPSRRGHGYATEALVALLALAWHESALTTVIASTDLANLASQRVLEKAGFVRAGATEDQLQYRCDRPTRTSEMTR